jgi:dolichyl-phosphate beta-glucosyltransferase
VTGLKIKDHTCGFKLFSRKVVSEIFSIAVIDRWAFDTEILYLAKKMKYPVVEVGVRWANDANSRMRLFRDAFLICMDLVRIITVHRKD